MSIKNIFNKQTEEKFSGYEEGFVIGMPGSGRAYGMVKGTGQLIDIDKEDMAKDGVSPETVFMKKQIKDVLRNNPENEVIVLDLEGQYTDFAIGLGGDVIEITGKSYIDSRFTFSEGSRIFVFNLMFAEGNKKKAMKAIIPHIKNRMVDNRAKGKKTWVVFGMHSFRCGVPQNRTESLPRWLSRMLDDSFSSILKNIAK